MVKIRSSSAILAHGSARLMDDDGGKQRKQGLEAIPDPPGEVFAGGIFKAFNFVEVVVIEALNKLLSSALDIAIINQVTHGAIDFAFDDDIEAERVAMHTAA